MKKIFLIIFAVFLIADADAEQAILGGISIAENLGVKSYAPVFALQQFNKDIGFGDAVRMDHEITWLTAHKLDANSGWILKDRVILRLTGEKVYIGAGGSLNWLHTDDYDKVSLGPVIKAGFRFFDGQMEAGFVGYMTENFTLNRTSGIGATNRITRKWFVVQQEIVFVEYEQLNRTRHGVVVSSLAGVRWN